MSQPRNNIAGTAELRILERHIAKNIEDQRDLLERRKDPIEAAEARGAIKGLRRILAEMQGA